MQDLARVEIEPRVCRHKLRHQNITNKMKRTMARSTEFGSCLAACVPEVRTVATNLYRLVRRHLPRAVESWDGERLGLGYSLGYKGLVFVLSPQRAWITLGIAHAVDLPDPAGLMEGKGKVHRHVKLRSLADVRSPRLAALIRSAVIARKPD